MGSILVLLSLESTEGPLSGRLVGVGPLSVDLMQVELTMQPLTGRVVTMMTSLFEGRSLAGPVAAMATG